MIRKKMAKYLCLIVSSITITTMISGCAGKKNAGSTNDAASTGAPTTITMMCPFYLAQPPKMEGNPIVDKLQKTTNTKLDVQYVPAGNYKDKLNVLIASNQLPMVIVADAGAMRSSNVVNSANNGMFWEVGPLIKNYDNLKKFYSDQKVIDNALIGGKLYGLPTPRVLGKVGLIIRQDWLDNLGLKMPKTPEDVYQVAKAFTENDPDKNGTNDTLGLEYADLSVGSYGWNGISQLTVAYGGPNNWGLVDGKMTPDFATPQYLQALNLLRKMYQEKLMNQDFPLVSGNKRYDAYNAGKVGMLFCSLNDAYATISDNIIKTVPSAKISVVPTLSGPSGQRQPASPGHNGIFMFSKTSVKTEADLNKILAFYNRMTASDMIDLFTYGVEGIHYNVVNGVKTPVENSTLQADGSDLASLMLRPPYVETPTDKPMVKAVYAEYKANEKFLVNDPTISYDSATKAQVGGELDKVIFDARVKYVSGAIDEAGWKKALDDWKARGGSKVIDEFTAEYNKYNKK